MRAKGTSVAAQHDGDEPALGRPRLEASLAKAKVADWAERWWGVMARVAARLLEDRDAAEDAVQRAFMRALSLARSDPHEVERIRNPGAWMAEITRKQAVGVLRTEARRRELRRNNGDEIRDNLFPVPGAERDENPRSEQALEAATRVLTQRQLEVFLLAWDGMADEEIARRLGLKRGTVRRHRTAAIRKLREHMSQGGGTPP